MDSTPPSRFVFAAAVSVNWTEMPSADMAWTAGDLGESGTVGVADNEVASSAEAISLLSAS